MLARKLIYVEFREYMSKKKKQISIQAFAFHWSVCMSAISYNAPMSVPPDEQLLGDKRMYRLS